MINSIFKKPLLIIALLTSCTASVDRTEVEATKLSAVDVYAKTVNNTVTIETDLGLGSGFYIDSNLIVTNYHVIEGSHDVLIKVNNSDDKVAVKGYVAIDKINDLIILMVDNKSDGFIKMGDKAPRPGEKIYAIGSPAGLSKTISEGIVSGIQSSGNRKLFQITAPISHGSSGCPILNESGALIGVAVGGIENANSIGFCIPTSLVKVLIEFKNDYATNIESLLPDVKSDVKTKLAAATTPIKPVFSKPTNTKSKITHNNIIPKSPRIEVGIPLSKLDKKYIGMHEFRVSTIDNNITTNGKVYISVIDGRYYLKGSQADDSGKRKVDISGEIQIINTGKFIFVGKLKLHNPKQGDCVDCEWDGEIEFNDFGYGQPNWTSCGSQSSSPVFGCIFINW